MKLFEVLLTFGIGAVVGLLGDACHVASGTTVYAASAWPNLGLSPIWFVLVVGGSVAGVAQLGRRFGLPSRPRTRAHLATAIAAGLALYALTATLREQTPLVSVVLIGAIALAFWFAWDPSPKCLALGLACAVAGPIAEISLVHAGLYHYVPGSDALYGVAAWLPCLQFALGVVASGLLRPLTQPSS